MSAQILASIIQQASHIREESWDWPAYAKDLREAHNRVVAQRQADRDNPPKGDPYLHARTSVRMLPRHHYYSKTPLEAATEACNNAQTRFYDTRPYAGLVDNMLTTMWNDALAWAKNVLGAEPPERSPEANAWRDVTQRYFATDMDTYIPEPT